jgi:hypothetical protein
MTGGASESRLQERGLVLVICGIMLIVSLYLEQEVRDDEEEGQQLAAGTGVVARPRLVARAGDRRLLAGAASPARIYLRPKSSSGENSSSFLEHTFGVIRQRRKAACYRLTDALPATTRLPWRPLDTYLADTIAQHGVET